MTTHAQSGQAHKANRLINETSTYLLQHAHNPVDWYPWGEEAIDTSRREDKPILLSVGYSACHWCHVMERESFEDAETAELMNKLFVCVKVDREERPDIDEIYMKSVQMLTGHGGWPMTVFLTPNLKPFFAGTYFPPQDRHGIPSFKRVLSSVAAAWKEQRDAVENSAEEITSHLSVFDLVPENEAELNHKLIESALDKLWHVFDREFGGFGSAPKFPHPSTLSLVARHSVAHEGWDGATSANSFEMLSKTLDEMAYGGIHDQLGGGFARYAVDRIWLIPHFEKMLYDNAQIARNFLEGYQLTGRDYWARVARSTLDFVLREMTTPEGAFYSSLDADTEGVEGKFYVWTKKEIFSVLGDTDGKWFCQVFAIEDDGNFEHGTSVLHLFDSPEGLARSHNISVEDLWKRIDGLREKLLAVRDERVRPGRDEKVLLSWNSLMISAFVDGYRVLKDRSYLATARRAADFVLENMYKDDRLLRTWGRGQAKLHGYLDDYAYFIQSLLDLSAVDFDTKWLETALKLNEVVIAQFTDERDGGLFYTSAEHEKLIARTKTFYDASVPSPTAVATRNFLRLATMFDRQDLHERARAILKLYAPFFEKVPDQFSSFLNALDDYLSPPTEIAFVTDAEEDGWEDMLLTIHGGLLPNSVIMLNDCSAEENPIAKESPLLAGKELVGGNHAVYICRKYTCEKPITDLSELKKAIDKLALRTR